MEWMRSIAKKWEAAISHAFILHFNVRDTIDGVDNVVDRLMQMPLLANRDIIIYYNRSSGFVFPLPVHRDNLLDELELPKEEGDEELFPREPEAALPLIEAALKLSREKEDGELEAKTAVVIDYAETIVPPAELSHMAPQDRTVLTTIQRWATDKEISGLGSPVFLITENLTDIHPVLRTASSRIEAVEVSLPDTAQRKKYIEGLTKKYPSVSEDADAEQLARMTAGLKRLHLEDIFMRAEVDEVPVSPDLVKERKDEIVKSEFGEMLQIPDPVTTYDDIGGHSHLKQFIERNATKPMKEGNSRRCPMGILLTGPAGTGKTALAEAIATESGVNCCILNLNRIMDKWVGSSESNLFKALKAIEALEPTIVVIDEIDQSGLGRESGGDSGVSNRLFKQLLEFMSDTRHRGKVLFIGLTNRPDMMDAALKRPGRFDKKIPVLPPSREDRKEIMEVMFKKYDLQHELSPEDLNTAAEKTDGYTGAEIEALVIKAGELMEDCEKEKVTWSEIEHALNAYRPTTQNIDSMARLAIDECNDLDLLPPDWREKFEERKRKEQKSNQNRERQRRTVN